MDTLDTIPVIAESSGCGAGGLTENALPLLHEIRHALQRLAQSNESTVFDLRAIPFAPGDEERLMSLLGEGEVDATIDALGKSQLRETAFPGVWVVEHYSPEEERIALQIEVTDTPAILKSQKADIEESFTQLGEVLKQET